jgi:integrase
MSTASYGAKSRQPVYLGTRRIPGLYVRVLADGTEVYDANLRIGKKMKRYALKARTKTDAIRELEALRVDLSRGESHRSSAATMTIQELARDYIGHLRTRVGDNDPRRRRSSTTADHYEDQLRLHLLPTLGHLSAPDVTVADLRRWLDRLAAKRIKTRDGKTKQYASKSRNGLLGIVSGMLGYGVRIGAVPRNVARDLDRDDRPGSGRSTEPRYLTVEQIVSLLAEMTHTFRPIAMTCAYAGLRLSEALGLRWGDLDLKAGTITVTAQLSRDGERVPPKTPASLATVPMLPALAAELRAHRGRVAGQSLARVRPDELVFTTATGKPQSHRNVLRAVHGAGDAAGLNPNGIERAGVHDLRHSFVALTLAAGMTLPEAAALARHANPRVTATVYAGLTEESREQLRSKLLVAFGG